MADTVIRDFTVEIVRNKKTDLLMAYSTDIPGLLVPARGEEELDRRLPIAIRQLLEAQGATEISMTLESEPRKLPPEFIPSRFTAHVSLLPAR